MGQEVYVDQHDTCLMVGFKLWAGKNGNMEGYLYSEMRLADSQIGQNPNLRIGPLLVAVERRIDDHWYFIAYRID